MACFLGKGTKSSSGFLETWAIIGISLLWHSFCSRIALGTFFFFLFFQHSTWLRLRGDLNSYLRDLKLSEQFSSELVKLVLLNSIGSGKELYQRFVMKEQDAQKMRKRYSQLVANHQQLRKDYQKLIGKLNHNDHCSWENHIGRKKNTHKN